MASTRIDSIIRLLKGIETGDPLSVEVINAEKYIQHNPQTFTGREGLATLFKKLSLTSPRVNIVRIFEDGDYVFAHTEYDFATPSIGFEVFRFEGNTTVEHWDNIQQRKGPNDSNHSMVDGQTEVIDLEKTDENRQIVKQYVDEILINGKFSKLDHFMNGNHFIQHNPFMSDGRKSIIASQTGDLIDGITLEYKKSHRILANGNFVLTVCEGFCNAAHAAIYDLYRVEKGMLVEHWDTIETVPGKDEWKNDNGKF